MLDYELSTNNAGSVIFVEWHELHIAVTIEIHDYKLLADLGDHMFFTFHTKLELFDAEPLVLKVLSHKSLGYLEVPHIPTFFVVTYFLTLRQL